MRSILLVGVSAIAAAPAAVVACGSPAPVSAPTTPRGPEPIDAATPDVDAGVCGGRCTGRAGSALVEALSFRARQAHRCYDNALAQDKSIRGKVIVRVRLGADGRVCDVNAQSEDAAMADVATCVAGFYRANTAARSFPPPDDGCIDVAVPINFVPRGEQSGSAP